MENKQINNSINNNKNLGQTKIVSGLILHQKAQLFQIWCTHIENKGGPGQGGGLAKFIR